MTPPVGEAILADLSSEANRVCPFPERGPRYFRYSDFLKQRFGKSMVRVTVDGGFTCPNVDGAVALGGCTFCDNRSFSPSRRDRLGAIDKQLEHGLALLDERYAPEGFLAYFQAGTNTYAPVEKLRRIYERALANPKIEGIVIGTRPDCVPDPVLDLLEELASRTFVAIELGLQSIHEKTLGRMNRGHDAACFFDAVRRIKSRRCELDVSVHVILGFPGESTTEMLETVDAVANSAVDGIKIHNLYVVKDTPLAEEYLRGEFDVLDRDEYLELLIAALERLPSTMVVHRVTGDAPDNFLIAPIWVRRKAEFLQALDRSMIERGAWQGRLYRPSPILIAH